MHVHAHVTNHPSVAIDEHLQPILERVDVNALISNITGITLQLQFDDAYLTVVAAKLESGDDAAVTSSRAGDARKRVVTSFSMWYLSMESRASCFI